MRKNKRFIKKMSVHFKKKDRVIHVPVFEMIQDAFNLYSVCEDLKTKLIKTDLDWSIVENLLTIAQQCDTAQAIYHTHKQKTLPYIEKWNDCFPEVTKLIEELLDEITKICIKNYLTTIPLRKFKQYRSKDDIIQDLSDLSVAGDMLCKKYAPQAIEKEKLEKAEFFCHKLAWILGEEFIDKEYRLTLREERDTAYLQLKEAMDSIRRFGYKTFKNDKKIRKLFACPYRKKHRGK